MNTKQKLLTLALAAGFATGASGQAFIDNPTPGIGDSGVFAYWNFNNGSSNTSGTFSSDYLDPAFGTSSLSIAEVTDQSEVTVFAGTVTNLASPDPDGTGRGVALAIRNGSSGVNNGSSIEFDLDMTNLEDLSFSFAAQRTSTGFDSLVVDYSVDGGSNYLGSIAVPTLESSMGTTSANPDAIRTVDLSSVSGLDGLSSALVRLTFDGGSTTSNAGNNRLDNFQFSATAVPEPETFGAIAGVLALGLAMVRRRRRA